MATDSRDPSGLGEHMLALGKALADEFDIVVAGPGDASGLAFLKRAAEAGMRVKCFELDNLSGFTPWLAASGVDILHVHAGIGWEGHDLARAGKAAGLPVIRTEHLPYLLTSPVQQAEYGAMLQSVDRVITVSRAAYDSFASRHGTRHLSLVLNGVVARQTRNERATVRSGLGLLAQDQALLTIARFTPQKGHSTLLDAVPEVLKSHPDARFIWVGDGPEFNALSEAVVAAGLTHAVMLLGQRDDIGDLLQAADLFILPSLFEGLPLVLLEAMAAGLPVVASRIGGSREAIGDDHPFLAEPGDAAALANAITQALGDPDAASAAGQAGQRRFQSQFDAARMARQTAEIYRTALAEHSQKIQVRRA